MNKIFILLLAAVFLIVVETACKTSDSSQIKDNEFISLAYVALGMLKLNTAKPEEVRQILDSYNWNGISDIALIDGIYFTGKNGSINTKWNEHEWPEVFSGKDYLGREINENRHRKKLCSHEVVDEVIKYFQDKGMKIWISQTGAGWLTGGSFGVVLESPELIKSYAGKLVEFARQLGCVGIDFDWEFPPNDIQAEGYRKLMKEVKGLGLKVSVCAIRPAAGKEYLDQCIEPEANIDGNAGKYMKWEKIIGEQIADNINVMQYLGYDPGLKQLSVKVKAEKMAEWEKFSPNEFTENRKVKFLSGIGYYSFLMPEYRKGGHKGGKSIQYLYDTYGKSAINNKVIHGHVIWSTSDVREIVKYAKKQGWCGVFTWLVTHDVTNDIPEKYSRQNALAEEVYEIWASEVNQE